MKTSQTSPLERARNVLSRNLQGHQLGLTSVCSAHPLVLRAALAGAHNAGQIALIEATCNQVNQEGGYTGMQPADFVALVAQAAADEGVPMNNVLLGGDHLGPQPWRHLPGDQAMEKATAMVRAYVAAGFGKIHLDCSMRCADDPQILPEDTIAARAVTLAQAAESAALSVAPIYIIGTEVPPPGGMGAGHKIVATPPDHAAATWAAHRTAFAKAGLADAFGRVCGLVVQPGLDFGNAEVVHFYATSAQALSATAAKLDGAVFEAHSTDYQNPAAYPALVSAHFAILKVGPAATFALREAIYALEGIASEIAPTAVGVRAALEAAMLDNPSNWDGHYQGDAATLAWLRHFSFSDRLRYYWQVPSVAAAVADLFATLDNTTWPLPLVSQYLPLQYAAIAAGELEPTCENVVKVAVQHALAPYLAASDLHDVSGQS